MGQLVQNPNARMQSMLDGPRASRDAAVARFRQVRDSHFGISRRPGSALGRVSRSTGGFGDAVMEGLTPILRTQVMLNEWERAAAAERAYQQAVQRAAAKEYWAQRREQAKAEYQRSVDEEDCGNNQECRARKARQKYGTRLPASGTWSGEPGNSTWTPDKGTPAHNALQETNAARAAKGQPPLSGVRYNNGHPNFAPFSKSHVRIEKMQGNLNVGPDGDVGQARAASASKYGDSWSRSQERGRVWHHHQDAGRMLLVDERIHNSTIRDAPSGTWVGTGGALHSGGASVAKSPLF